MNLVYFDESGNSGNNLTDNQQPVFLLCALVVPAVQWQEIEGELSNARLALFPDPVPDEFEVHGAQLVNPRKGDFFRDHPVATRLQLYRDWMDIAQRRNLKVFYRAILKKRYARWLQNTFGAGVLINPHVAAFSLLAQVINEHLLRLQPPSLGILISDENREVVKDIEKSIRALRLDSSNLRLGCVVEKGFFIESHQSLLLQLCDLCAYALRKKEEAKIGRPLNRANQAVSALADPLVTRGREAMPDVLAWLQSQYKEGAARGQASGTE